MWNDWQIKSAQKSGELGIEPFDVQQVQPASYDVRLDATLREPMPGGVLDLAAVRPDHTRLVEMGEEGYTLLSGAFVLGSTVERIRMPDRAVCAVEGKSSLGRLGLAVHVTAGFVDPGFEGQITLELYNHFPRALRLVPGMRIAQLAFTSLQERPERVYGRAGNRYQGQVGPVESRYEP